MNSATDLTSHRLAGLLAEPERRRVVAALILGSDTVDEVVQRSGLDRRSTVRALDRLVGAGLVETLSDGRLHLLEEAFKVAARSEAESASSDNPVPGAEHESAHGRRILTRSVVNGRLVRLPAKWSHKLVVLDWVAQRFQPGERYRERQVNAVLAAIHDDTATLRRYLVDAGMMERDAGWYWRSGGTVPID